jgi:outer membrane protein OmpA-like peptidoglycan-associated protein
VRAAVAYAAGAAFSFAGGAADLVYLNVAVAPQLFEVPPVVRAPLPTPAADPPPAPEPPPPPPVEERIEAPVFESVAKVQFKTASSQLDAPARAEIAAVAERLRADPRMVVRADGHADERGPASFNLELSERRAGVVAGELERLGIAADRIEQRAHGEEGAGKRWSRDRRVEVWIGGPRR